MPRVLCLVTDRRLVEGSLAECVGAAVRGGADRVQLRERDLGGAALLALARDVGAAARQANPAVTLLINGRVDVALAAGWDGVHLGWRGMAVSDARHLLGPGAHISVATHREDELERCPKEERPDSAHLAPIWAPQSKPATTPALGPDALRQAAGHGVPVLAQGGVTPQTAAACRLAGAAGIAVTGALLQAADPEAVALALRTALDADD